MTRHFLLPALLTALCAPPALSQNDSCSTPTAILGSGPFAVSTTNATTGSDGQSSSLCSFSGTTGIERDVWFSWTAPTTGHATFTMCGTTTAFDAKAAVYAGSTCGAPIQGCADDTCGTAPQVDFLAFEGLTYLIQIGSKPGTASGVGSFSLTVAPGLWDRFLEAPTITPGSAPGKYNVRVAMGVAVGGELPTGSNVGAIGTLYVNGLPWGGNVPIDPGPWDPPQPGNSCNSSATPCSGCAMTWGGFFSLNVCRSDWGWCWTPPPPPGYNSCSCVKRDLGWLEWTDVAMSAGSQCFARVVAAPGALPEDGSCNDTSASTVLDVPGTPYCFGDGSGAACPCGNVGAAGNGCANSLFTQGANLSATGVASVGADTVVLTSSSTPNSSVLYFQGTTAQAGGNGSPFGDGLRCAAGSVVRLGTKIATNGVASYPSATDQSVSVRGVVSAGNTRRYQGWYRNAAAFCTASTFNLTNGYEIVWSP